MQSVWNSVKTAKQASLRQSLIDKCEAWKLLTLKWSDAWNWSGTIYHIFMGEVALFFGFVQKNTPHQEISTDRHTVVIIALYSYQAAHKDR